MLSSPTSCDAVLAHPAELLRCPSMPEHEEITPRAGLDLHDLAGAFAESPEGHDGSFRRRPGSLERVGEVVVGDAEPTAFSSLPSAARDRYSIETLGSTVLVRIESMMRPPDSALLQRLTISLTASSLYSNGILWFSATRFLIRLSCSRTIWPSISSRQRVVRNHDQAPEQRRREDLLQRLGHRRGERLGIGQQLRVLAHVHDQLGAGVRVSRMIVFLKSIIRPSPSSIRPLSKTWKNSSCTSGWAFSTSSSRTTL